MTEHHPFAYNVGPIALTGFGLAVLMAFLIAQIISQRELARRGHDPEPIGDLIIAAVVGGLLGAKLYYVAIISHNASDFFTRGGFVFWGGLIGGVIAVTAVVMKKKLSIMRISDVGGIAVAAAYAVGRTGCWAVGDDYGRPWASRFAVSFPQGAPPSTAREMVGLFHIPVAQGVSPETVLSVYPTQLYEVVLGFLMFWILWRLRDHKHAEGWLFGVYMVLAGIERFGIEFLRAKDDRFFGILTTAQVIALAFIVLGAIWMRARSEVRGDARGIYAAAL